MIQYESMKSQRNKMNNINGNFEINMNKYEKKNYDDDFSREYLYYLKGNTNADFRKVK